MLHKQIFFPVFVFLVVFLINSSRAQVRFINPQFPGMQTDFRVNVGGGSATPGSGSIAIIPSSQASFSVTVYRPSSSSTAEGFVSIYSGVNGPTHQITNTTIGTYNTTNFNWTSSGGVDSRLLSGLFDTSSIPAGDDKVYAVFFNQMSSIPSQEDVSAPIAVVPGTQPPSGGGGNGTTQYCLPLGTAPKLTASFASNPLQYSSFGHYYRVKWQKSSDGINFSTVYTSESEYTYQTPMDLAYEKVYYQAILEDKVFPRLKWGRRDDFGSPNQFIVSRQGPVPVPVSASYFVCGSTFTAAVQGVGTADEYTYNWDVPVG